MRIKKLLKTGLAVVLTAMTLVQPVYAAGWMQNNTGWWWTEDNGSYPANQWKMINGTWYRFDSDGYMATGWRFINGTWYWLDSDGAMATGWRFISGTWYWFNSDGAMATGWESINGNWYYMESSGAMAASKWIGNYYVEASGAMATNKWIDNYYVNDSGLWTKTRTPGQWLASGDRWWYRHSDGSYTRSGWETIGVNDYLFDADGWMLTGWQAVNGNWYYLDSSGALATNTWIGDYYVNTSGVWVETRGQHNWDDGIVTTAATCMNTGVKTFTCKTCGETYTETLPIANHNWTQYTWSDIKQGFACNYCYNDITEYDDKYACHGGFHTQTFYQFPSYYVCSDCNKLLHQHDWYYVKPTFKTGTDEIDDSGYWMCYSCGNQSSDGIQADAILVSAEGHEYGSNTTWTTPFNFEKDSHEWIIENEYWEPADNQLHLQYISLNKSTYSMSVGDSYQYSVIFTPKNPVEGKNVTWESSNPSVVSVDSNVKITALQNGEATIAATSGSYTSKSFVRVTDENIGKVTSATLYINGQSNPNGVIYVPKGSYTVNLQTNPAQAVYEVRYSTEGKTADGYSVAGITGRGLCGDTIGWWTDVSYTDSSTTIAFLNSGTTTIKATITDVNGNKIELSQKVVVE